MRLSKEKEERMKMDGRQGERHKERPRLGGGKRAKRKIKVNMTSCFLLPGEEGPGDFRVTLVNDPGSS